MSANPQSLRARVAAIARQNPEVEICAVLLGSPHPSMPRPGKLCMVTNVHERPESNFLVSPLGFLSAEAKARENGLKVIGIVHSHVTGSAAPSEADREMILSDRSPKWWIWPIYSLRHDEFRIWAAEDGHVVDVTDREVGEEPSAS